MSALRFLVWILFLSAHISFISNFLSINVLVFALSSSCCGKPEDLPEFVSSFMIVIVLYFSDKFVVGYALDYNEYFRLNLDFDK